MPPASDVEYLNCPAVYGRYEQAIAGRIRRHVVYPALYAWQRDESRRLQRHFSFGCKKRPTRYQQGDRPHHPRHLPVSYNGGHLSSKPQVQVAIITGAAQGIGKRIAEVLGSAGYRLILTDLQSCASTLQGLQDAGLPLAFEVQADIASEQTARQIAEVARSAFGRADVLVNNAGISHISPAEETTMEAWQRVMNVNLLAPFLMCREIGRLMIERRSGSIVNIASIAGLLGVADRSAYNASKHGLIGLTRTLAGEWGGRGVRCNAVCPGWVKTPMDVGPQAAGLYADSDIEGRVPMGRFATPDDVAQAVAFLADPERSGFVNGHTLSVDGGWYSDASWESLRLRHR